MRQTSSPASSSREDALSGVRGRLSSPVNSGSYILKLMSPVSQEGDDGLLNMLAVAATDMAGTSEWEAGIEDGEVIEIRNGAGLILGGLGVHYSQRDRNAETARGECCTSCAHGKRTG